ncbi:protein of unknown function [Methylorubrum extorquens]|uniref:Uncharacterized protein n=1 Tax=Methylorubrum extorquens TaxID=408 RepID=A0A2N9AX25_METEX|nr:protein of unknown function [Methylorubrum extorquens]
MAQVKLRPGARAAFGPGWGAPGTPLKD